MFVGAAKKEQFMNTVEKDIGNFDRETELYSNIVNVIENHIANYIIPRFNRDKAMLYYKMLEYFSVHETHNWHLVIGFWRSIMKNKNILTADLC